MKKHVLAAIFGLFAWTVAAQVQTRGRIDFDKLEHDFGKIQEENGQVTAEFTFTNNGSAPLNLVEVVASCGCTTPAWTKDPIAPGTKGYIRASYDPNGRPGAFNKAVTVKTNGDPEIIVLIIKGEVIPRTKGPKDFYPNEMGNLRLNTTYINFGDVLHDGQKTVRLTLYNQGSQSITLKTGELRTPAHLSVTPAYNVTLGPADTTSLVFTYQASKLRDWGYTYEGFTLPTDDPNVPMKSLGVAAVIRENFNAGGENVLRPAVQFDKVEHDFGTMAQNQAVNTTFTITNNGQGTLIIRKTKASCGCTASNPRKMQLEPGESTTIDVSYNSGMQEGEQYKNVTVICNDPAKPETTLTIKAKVDKTLAPPPAPAKPAAAEPAAAPTQAETPAPQKTAKAPVKKAPAKKKK